MGERAAKPRGEWGKGDFYFLVAYAADVCARVFTYSGDVILFKTVESPTHDGGYTSESHVTRDQALKTNMVDDEIILISAICAVLMDDAKET